MSEGDGGSTAAGAKKGGDKGSATPAKGKK